MRAPFKYLKSATLVALLAFPGTALAQADEAPRFSDDDFLEEWSIFLSEEDKNLADDEGPVNLDAKDEEDEKAPGFLYFNTDGLSAAASTPLSLPSQNEATEPFTPRKTSLSNNLESIALPGESWLLNTFTPRYADAAVSFGGEKDVPEGEEPSKFEISVTTQVTSRQTNIFGAVNNDYVLEALNRQVYDLGVNLGYSGIGISASLRGEEGAYFDGISGYDLGLSYDRPTWSTSLLVGEYRQANNMLLGLGSGFYDERFFAIEVGAAYKMAPWFQVVGSFRYYEDANMILLNPSAVSTTSMFYLGTKLKF